MTTALKYSKVSFSKDAADLDGRAAMPIERKTSAWEAATEASV
jgi:hypothetical protein